MSKIGYARVSATDQKLDRQLELLKDCEKLFCDKITGITHKRPELQKMLKYIRENDIVVVAELDRLGRNNKDLTNIMCEIQNKGATIEALNIPSLNGIEDPNLRRLINNLIIEIYKYQAESEWKKIRERQQQGIELAKAAGKYTGRKRLFAEDDPRLQHAIELYKSGVSIKNIEAMTGINAKTFRRYLDRLNFR